MDSIPQEKPFKKYSRRKKILIGVIAFFGAVIIGGYVFVHFFLSPLVKNKIIQSVHVSSKGLYSLNIDDFALGFWKGAVYMDKVTLTQDSVLLRKLQLEDPRANYSTVRVNIKSIHISRIWWQNFLLDRSLEVGTIEINKPQFYFGGKVPEDTLKLGKQSFLELLPGLIASFAGSLKIKELTVNKGELRFDLKSKKGVSKQRADNIFINLRQIDIDTSGANDVLYTEYLKFRIENYELITDDQLYKLKIDKFAGSYADSTLQVRGISFNPVKKLEDGDLYKISIRGIDTRRINFALFFKEKKVSLGDMMVDSPDIKVAYKLKASTKQEEHGSMAMQTMLQIALPYVANTFKMNKLQISNGRIDSRVLTSKGLVAQRGDKINILLNGIVIDSATSKTGKIWKDISLRLNNYQAMIHPQNLKLDIGTISASTSSNSVRLNKLDFNQINKGGKNRNLFIKNTIESVKMTSVDFEALLTGSKVSMKRMDVSTLDLEILRKASNNDKSTEEYHGKMPHELIKTIPIYLRVDEIFIANANLVYKEVAVDVKEPVILNFDKIKLHVLNFTNDPKRMSRANPAVAEGHALVMGQGLLKLKMKVNLVDNNFNGSYAGSLGKMEAKHFNNLLEYAGMRLESGTIEAQKIKVNVTNGHGTGRMILIYHSLNTKLISKKKGKVKKVLSHIANFILKNENKIRGERRPEVVVIDYERQPEDDYINYIWNCINNAIIETVVKDFFEPFVKTK
ncbi:MAG TPA: hypothetical protein VF691_22080 [Cytophagaceae bacterium]|jgi:hypothetical protein